MYSGYILNDIWCIDLFTYKCTITQWDYFIMHFTFSLLISSTLNINTLFQALGAVLLCYSGPTFLLNRAKFGGNYGIFIFKLPQLIVKERWKGGGGIYTFEKKNCPSDFFFFFVKKELTKLSEKKIDWTLIKLL